MSTMTKNRPSASVRGSYSFREEGSHRGQKQPREHTPVMPTEALRMLAPQKGEVIVDATYGQGGHSALIKKAAKVKLIAIDADPAAGTGVIEGNFGDLESILETSASSASGISGRSSRRRGGSSSTTLTSTASPPAP